MDNFAMIPFVEEDTAIVKADIVIDFAYHYFIVARGYNGCRFISEDLVWEDTAEMFNKYCAMIGYVGDGGRVTLYEESLGDVVVIRETAVY